MIANVLQLMDRQSFTWGLVKYVTWQILLLCKKIGQRLVIVYVSYGFKLHHTTAQTPHLYNFLYKNCLYVNYSQLTLCHEERSNPLALCHIITSFTLPIYSYVNLGHNLISVILVTLLFSWPHQFSTSKSSAYHSYLATIDLFAITFRKDGHVTSQLVAWDLQFYC